MMADLLRLVVVLAVLVISQLVQKSNSVNNSLEVPANVGCACPEERLTFTCNIVGAGNTLWGGTAFNCPDSSNEIILRHSQFADGHSGRCSNDALMARSTGVTGNCFTSELEVTFSPSLNNTTVRCTHDSLNSGQIVIGSVSTLLVASGFDPPDSLNLVNICGGQAILEWSPVVSTCPQDIIYNISSNCSSCSSRLTNSTTASCPVPQPNATTGDTVCTFSIQSVVCEGIGGEQSYPLEVIIPAQPPSVEIIPVYSSANNALDELRILGNNFLIATSGRTDLFITTYNVIYSDPTTGSIVDSAIVNVEAASENITPPASLCPFTISVVADNGFEQRNLADPITIGCTNRFVEVQYNSATSTITCTFLNQLDTSLKTCRVSSCDKQQTNIAQESSPLSTITLRLESHNSLCYTVTARNSSFRITVNVAVEGRIAGGAAVSTGVIIGVVVVVTALILLATFVVLLVCYCRRKKKTGGVMVFGQLSIEVLLDLQEIDQGRFKMYTIQNSCKLREAAPFKKRGQFKRGYAYYEFKHEKENISEDKEIILMHKVTGHYFTPGPEVARDTLRQYRLLGDGVKKPDVGNYIVFVQSTGSGARHLPADSRLLYNIKSKSKWQSSSTLLMKVVSSHFMKTPVETELTLEEFRDEHSLTKNKCNVFLELKDVDRKNIEKFRDVILMKGNGDLFTGPGARSMIDAQSVEYRIFVLCVFKKDPVLKPGTDVLHQVCRDDIKDRFHVLKVKQDNVQMSTFVQEELGVKYENGRAFYEFTESEEDLQFYKDIMHMPKSIYSEYCNSAKQQKDEHQDDSESKSGKDLEHLDASRLKTGIMYYYLFSKAPGIAIKPLTFDNFKVFVQSTSQGSRCLKSETLLLYKATD